MRYKVGDTVRGKYGMIKITNTDAQGAMAGVYIELFDVGDSYINCLRVGMGTGVLTESCLNDLNQPCPCPMEACNVPME